MRVSILFILLFSNIFTQISNGGSPKFYNRQENVDFIVPDRDNLIDRGFAPMVFQFGEEYYMDVNIENTQIVNAKIGVASKDSSVTNLNEKYLKNLDTCFAAYNKKQEFNGAFIEMENMECKNYDRKANIDVHSKILKKNETLKDYDL